MRLSYRYSGAGRAFKWEMSVKLCEVTGGKRRERTVFMLGDIGAPIAIDEVGLSLDQGKALLAAIQSAVISIQSAALAEYARSRTGAESGVVLKDYRRRRIQRLPTRCTVIRKTTSMC